jgi:hypothetical protein
MKRAETTLVLLAVVLIVGLLAAMHHTRSLAQDPQLPIEALLLEEDMVQCAKYGEKFPAAIRKIVRDEIKKEKGQ